MRSRPLWGSAVVALAALAVGPARAATLVNGAGATFPYPIYSKWFDEFHRIKPDIRINYQSIGSGGGIRQILEGTVDFGASDGPMSDEQLAKAQIPILHFPTVLGAVVPTYNVAGIPQRLRFSPEVLAGIFRGAITRWDDPALVRDNPGVALPARPIVPVHRSDGSGTTYVFTDYLVKVDAEWAKSVGRGTSVGWPVGLGGKGNEGVAGLVQQTPFAIGYVELVYALQTKLAYGAVRNRAGTFVEPTIASVTAAAAAVAMPADFRVSVTDPPAPDAYPIASFTWLLIPSRIADETKGLAIRQFLEWMLGDGQGFAAALGYAPLPQPVIDLERKALDKVTVGGS